MSERYTIILEPMPNATPPIARIKAALKLLGRRFAMRCVDIKQHDPSPTPTSRQVADRSVLPAPDARSAPGRGLGRLEGGNAPAKLPDALASISATSRDIADSEASEVSEGEIAKPATAPNRRGHPSAESRNYV